MPRLSARSVSLAAWIGFAALLLWVSMRIPVFSRQEPSKAVVGYAPLFPYYFQTNIDAPLELSSSLGFPRWLRAHPNRVNRPLEYGLIAAARKFAALPVLDLVAPRAGLQRWGEWTAREYLSTYAIWILLNAALLAAAALLLHRLIEAHFGSAVALAAILFFLSSPTALLSLREVHNGVLHLFIVSACIAFWHAVLLGVPAREPRAPLSSRALILSSLGLGLLFLGKPCLEGFAAGALLCLWMRRWKTLLIVAPLVALPSGLWYLAVRAAGYPYEVGEVSGCGAGVWILHVGSAGNLWREIASFAADWARCHWENLGPLHLAFAAAGIRNLMRGRQGRTFLAIAALCLLVNAGFYFLVHRANGVYVMFDLIFLFVAMGEGLRGSAERWMGAWARPAWIGVAAALILQVGLNFRQLPHYGG